MKPLELTPAGILGTLAIFVVVAVCIRLGFWQLDRREQRLERNAAIAERMEAEPVALDAVPWDTVGLTHRRATVRGWLDGDLSVVLAGRSHDGAPGAHLLAPLRLGDAALLVNRGWLPAPDAVTVDLDAVALEGEVWFEGVLLPFPEVELERASGARFRRTWYRLAGDAIRGQYPYPVAPLYLLATGRPAGLAMPDTARGLPVLLGPPAIDAGPHLSYAIQWFSFAAIFLVGWAVLAARGGAGRGDRRRHTGAPPG